MLNVEIVYSPLNEALFAQQISLNEGATIQDAINASGILEHYPEVTTLKIGIFSKQAALGTPLRNGDRVEIYRPLLRDPKDRRRQIAKRK